MSALFLNLSIYIKYKVALGDQLIYNKQTIYY